MKRTIIYSLLFGLAFGVYGMWAAQQHITQPSTPTAGDGDDVPTFASKTQANFDELYPTAKGDQFVGTANDTGVMVGIGGVTDGWVWTKDDASTGGMKWATPGTLTETNTLTTVTTGIIDDQLAVGATAGGLAEYKTLPNGPLSYSTSSNAFSLAPAENVFYKHDTPDGTDPIATSSTDTLTWIAGTNITITGSAAADSITIDATATDNQNLFDEVVVPGTNPVATTPSDQLTLSEGSNITLLGTGSNTIQISATDTDTQLSKEQVEDWAGGLWTGNTETRATVVYQTLDNTLDITVDDMDNTASNLGAGTGVYETKSGLDLRFNSLVSQSTGLTISEDDPSNEIDFTLNQFSSVNAGVVPGSGGGTVNYLRADGSWATPPDTDTQLSKEQVEDWAGGLWTGNTETRATVVYQTLDNTLDITVDDMDNTASNLGAGTGVYETKSGLDLRFNSLVSQSTGLTISEDDPSNEIDFTLNQFSSVNAGVVPGSGGGTVNYLRADGSWATPPDTDTQLSKEQVEDWAGGLWTGNTETRATVVYQTLDNTLDITVDDMDNTASNLGAGTGVYETKSGLDLRFNSLVSQSTGLTISEDDLNDEIDFTLNQFSSVNAGVVPGSGGGTVNYLRADGSWAAPSGVGETNTASNLGAGIGVWETKVGVDLRFNSLVSQSTGLTISEDDPSDEIDFTLNQFSSVNAGVVPGSGGGTVNYLRADGSWATPPDTDTKLSKEQVEDWAGGLWTGNTETRATVVYQTLDNTLDITVNDMDNTASNLGAGTGLYETKSGLDLRFNSLVSQSTGLSISEDDLNDEIDFTLNQFSSVNAGVVPGSGGGTVNYLRADGSWATPPSAGDPNQNLYDDLSADSGTASAFGISDTLRIEGGTGISTSVSDGTPDTFVITNTSPNVVQDTYTTFTAGGGSATAQQAGDQINFVSGLGISIVVADSSPDYVWITNTQPNVNQDLWDTIHPSSGYDITPTSPTQQLNVVGTAPIIVTGDGSDTLTISYSGELNNLENFTQGIQDDKVAVGIAINDAKYTSLVNGVLDYNTITNTFSLADITDLNDVGSKTGVGNIVVFREEPVLVKPNILDFTSATHDHADSAGGGALGIFKTVSVTGQNAIATAPDDTLTFVANGGLTIVGTNPDTITFTNTVVDTDDQWLFNEVIIAGSTNAVADKVDDELTLVAGTDIGIVGSADDTITISYTGSGSGDPNQNLFETVSGDSGIPAVADLIDDTIQIIGGANPDGHGDFIATTASTTPDKLLISLNSINGPGSDGYPFVLDGVSGRLRHGGYVYTNGRIKSQQALVVDTGGHKTAGTAEAMIYGYDDGGWHELWAVTSSIAGFQITPHDANGRWVHHSFSGVSDQELYIEMQTLIRFLAELYAKEKGIPLEDVYKLTRMAPDKKPVSPPPAKTFPVESVGPARVRPVIDNNQPNE